MDLKIRGVNYNLEIHQDKSSLPYFVLLHGFMGSGKSFSHIIHDLIPFCNPVTIDLLGHGDTEGPELYYRYASKEQIADLIKLISEQLPYPLFLLGYSMGGRLAFQLAFTRQDLFSGLIVESSTFGLENETERQARQALDAERADAISGNYEGFLEEWKKMPLFQSEYSDPKLLEYNFEIARSQNPIAMNNSLLGFGTGTMPCFKEKLKEIQVPVKLIVGESDSKFIHINQTIKKEIQNSDLAILQNASHRVHLDNPSDYISEIRKFITQNNAQ